MSSEGSTLTRGSVLQQLLMLAIPLLAGNVAESLTSTIDAFWIGRGVGSTGFAAAANANMILQVMRCLAIGITTASAVLLGQCLGTEDRSGARSVVVTGGSVLLALSVGMSAIGWLGGNLMLRWIGLDEAGIATARAYFDVVLLGLPVANAVVFAGVIAASSGDTKSPFLFLALNVTLEAVLDPVLIFGLGPFPRLGLVGSAWASVTANVITLLAMIRFRRRLRSVDWLTAPGEGAFAIDVGTVRWLAVRGLLISSQLLIVWVSMAVQFAMANRFGPSTSAAFAACFQSALYVQMPTLAVGTAVSSIAAQCVGALQWRRLDEVASAGVLLSSASAGLLALVASLAPGFVLQAFLAPGSPEMESARHILPIVVWAMVLFGVSSVFAGIIRSSGAVIPVVVIVGTGIWCVRMPFAYLLTERLGAEAVWWSFPIGSLATAGLAWLYFRHGRWRPSEVVSGLRTEESIS